MATIYDSVILDEAETQAALHEGRVKKYFHLKSRDYWLAQEQKAIDNHEEEKRLNRIKSAQLRNQNKEHILPSILQKPDHG